MAETGKTAPTQNVRHLDKNNLFLCLDTLRAGDAAGRILNAYWPEEIPFNSLAEMLLKADALCSSLHSPQSFMELRREERPTRRRAAVGERPYVTNPATPCYFSLDQLRERFGQGPVVTLTIRFRCNATWQGEATLLRRGVQPQSFRSALELLSILDGWLQAMGAQAE